ncbi:TlpA family protein disulfide reductase [Psychromonas sp.]|nr:TlpA family protein disulfide reductase [Psychromonas sp.]
MRNLLKPICIAFFVLSTAFTVNAETVEDMPLTGLVDTQDTSFGQLKGQWLYVDFWASWCIPCKKSFPFMNELQNVFKDKNVRVIAISVDDTEAAAVKFLKYNKTDFWVFHDPKGKLASEFKVPGMPSSYLINPEGEIVYKHVGFTEESGNEIINVINKSL